jgi:hydrogenase maturation protease
VLPAARIAQLVGAPVSRSFDVPAADVPGRQVRLEGRVLMSSEPVSDGVFRLSVAIENLTRVEAAQPIGDDVMLHALVSTHTILRSGNGKFISLTDPPASLRPAAAACRNVGTWPVLAGDPGSRDTLLSSPIIVSDYPAVAPESPGDFFDGTEMDEMLSLRILTLTDDEKREMRESDDRARRLLERTEACTAEELMRLHGAMRSVRTLGGGP